MKRILFALSVALCFMSCTKFDLIARYSFEVDDPTTKAVITGTQPLTFEYEAGDKIDITVRVLNGQILKQSGGLLPDNYVRSEQKCYLVYDGSKWSIDNSGITVQDIVVTGKEGDTVEISYDFKNQPEGDYSKWFSVCNTKGMPLKSGSQSVTIDFTTAESLAGQQ